MLTILEAIQLSAEYLDKKGIESPRANAELLLADILNCKRLNLYLSFDKPLSDAETVKYREYIQRRGKFEPAQYITGKTDFYGMDFIIKPNILIPRPETEFLIEAITGQYAKDTSFKILDIGCGSGIISVALAKHYSNAEITSIDINEDALDCAAKNSEKHGVNSRISFMKIDILSDADIILLNKYDLIVSNPPYVSVEEYNTLQNEIIEFEPKNAITDFKDGYTFYKRIISIAKDKLQENGCLCFEMCKGQSENIKKLLDESNFTDITIVKDLQGIDRIISGKLK